MTKETSPKKTTHGFAFDSMSTATFQALRAAAKAGGKPASPQDYEVRIDSISSTNFQALTAHAKPAAQSSGTERTTPLPKKNGVRSRG